MVRYRVVDAITKRHLFPFLGKRIPNEGEFIDRRGDMLRVTDVIMHIPAKEGMYAYTVEVQTVTRVHG